MGAIQMDETQQTPCTNHAVNLTNKIDLSKFTPETQEKMKKMIEDFNTQYHSINWERVGA
jgi:hypothetical protein